MAKFRGNNRAWFVVSFVLRHVGRDDLCSPWYLAVNCFLRKRFTGNSMKQHAESNKTTAHNKETNFNQYMEIHLSWHYTWNQNKIQKQSLPLEFPLTPSAFILSLSPRTSKSKETWSVEGFMVETRGFFWTHHTKDLCNVKAQFKPKMVGFQTILGLDVVEVWKSFCEVLFQWKRWYDRTRKWVVMGFVSVWTFEIL